MIALTDDEMTMVMDAARPLQPQARSEFLHELAAALEGQRERGPGVVYRIARDLQRKFFDPPDLTSVAKYE